MKSSTSEYANALTATKRCTFHKTRCRLSPELEHGSHKAATWHIWQPGQKHWTGAGESEWTVVEGRDRRFSYSSGVSYRSPTASGSGRRRADQSRLFSGRRRFRMNVNQISCQICSVFVNMHVKLLSSEAFFQPKMQQISFSSRAPPKLPLGCLQRSPRPLSCIKRTFGIPHPRCWFAKRGKTWLQKYN